jgi:flagellar motor component MotA
MGFVFAVLGVGLILAGICMGAELGMFIDLPSVAIVTGCTVFFTFAHHSVGQTFKAFGAAISGKDVSAADGQTYIRILSTTRVLASASGMLGSLIGLVSMLANMSDPSAIGPAMAVALLTLLYGVFIAEVFVGPLINRVRNQMVAGDTSEAALKVSAVTVVAAPMALLCFFVMMLSLKG